MNPITPARFYELLKKSDNDYISLWDSRLNDYCGIACIEKESYTNGSYDLQGVEPSSRRWHPLKFLYESKPETLYDELKSCINNERYHKLIDKHRDYLVLKIIEEPNETNN